MQMNTDVHDPEFCIDNFRRIVNETGNQTIAEQTCPVDDNSFSGAPPSVSDSLSSLLPYFQLSGAVRTVFIDRNHL